MLKKFMSEWRKRVLDRLDSARGKLRVTVSSEKLSQMYEVAESWGSQEEVEEKEEVPSVRTVKLLSASCSYVQVVRTDDVPYHYQIVVPGATGTAHANPQQLYEVSVWERCLLQIFWNAGVNCTRFEFCNCRAPLIIDVFPTPEVETVRLYWKSAFDEIENDCDARTVQLQTRTLRQMFPQSTSYVAVIFDDGTGQAKVCNGRSQVRKLATDVVAGLWRETKDTPPENLDKDIVEYEGWPT